MQAEQIEAKFLGKFGEAIEESSTRLGEATLIVSAGSLREICRYAKSDPELAFDLLLDVTAVDRLHLPDSRPRYELVVHLRSLQHYHLVRLKVRVEEAEPRVPSIVEIYSAANWFEREVWDMFGITFEGHPDLRRILMYPEFEGHPLRRDYPYQRQHPLVPHQDVWTPGIPYQPQDRWDQYAGDRRESPA